MEAIQLENFLFGQKRKLFSVMKDKGFRTLRELEEANGFLQTSISSNLRLLKTKTDYVQGINKRKNEDGLFEYQMIPKGEGH